MSSDHLHDSMIGCGYNNFTGRIVNKMLKNIQMAEEPIGRTKTRVHICESVEEVEHALNVEVTAEGSGFGMTLENKFSFAQKASASTTSVSVLFVTSKVTKSVAISEAELKDVATANDLFRKGGDSFLSEEVLGAQFCVSLEFVCHDSSQTKTVSDELKATYNDGVLSGSADASVSVKDFEKKHSVTCNITFFSVGFGDLETTNLTDVSAIIKFASGLSGKKVEVPAVVYRKTRSYYTLASLPADWKLVEDKRKLLMEGDGDEESPGYQAVYNTAVIARKKSTNLQEIYAFYGQGDIDEERFKAAQASLKKTIHEIAHWKATVADNPVSTTIPAPAIDTEPIKVPTLKFDMDIARATAGGLGGSGFQDVGPDLIPACIYMKRIDWRSGTYIDQVTMTYGFAVGGRKDLVKQHGCSEGGTDQGPIIRTEYSDIRQLDVYAFETGWGAWVVQSFSYKDSITAASAPDVTVDICRTSGDQGTKGVTISNTEKRKVFVGWAGRCGTNLDQITLIWAIFKAPLWKKLDFPNMS